MVEFRFEYDEEKSRANKTKHGIDFEQAQALWLDRRAVSVPAGHPDEERHIITGLVQGKLWSAVITYREGRVRIISVRRARSKEAREYVSEEHQR